MDLKATGDNETELIWGHHDKCDVRRASILQKAEKVIVVPLGCRHPACDVKRYDRVSKARERTSQRVRSSGARRWWWMRFSLPQKFDDPDEAIKAVRSTLHDHWKEFLDPSWGVTGMLPFVHLKPDGYVHIHALGVWTEFHDIKKGSAEKEAFNQAWSDRAGASCRVEYIDATSTRDPVAYAMKYVTSEEDKNRWWGHLNQTAYLSMYKTLKGRCSYSVWGEIRGYPLLPKETGWLYLGTAEWWGDEHGWVIATGRDYLFLADILSLPQGAGVAQEPLGAPAVAPLCAS